MVSSHNHKKQRNSGFTLTELIVVLVLLAVLAGLTIFGIVSWQRYASFKKQEEHAQALYLAAQRELSAMRDSGELDTLRETIGTDSLMKTASYYGIDNEAYDGRLCYIIWNGEETTPAGLEDEFQRLLGDTVMDETVLSARICIEFDPSDGVVYSVFYSDDPNVAALSYYEEYEFNTSGTIRINDRSYDRRKDLMLGYYSSDLSDAAPSGRNLVMGALELVNDDFLYLKWNMKNVSDDLLLAQLTYTIELYDEADDPLTAIPIVTLKTVDAINGLTKCELYVGSDTTSIGIMSFESYVEDGSCYMLLDAIDPNSAYSAYDLAIFNALSGSESLARLIPYGLSVTDNIYIKMSASSAGYRSSAKQQSNTSSAFFHGSTLDGSAAVLSIAKARHLYNVRFAEAYTADKTVRYQQTADLTFDKSSLRYDSIVLQNNAGVCTALSDADFPMLASLAVNHSYDASHDTNKRYYIDSLTIAPISDSGGNTLPALGLFGENRGTISGIVFKNLVVSVPAPVKDNIYATGGVCGINYGSLQNIDIQGGRIDGDDFVGGFAGRDCGNPRDNAYSLLKNNAFVSGTSFVGGIVGSVVSENNGDRITIDECASYQRIIPTSTSRCIGGIAGLLSGEHVVLSNCRAASLLTGENAQSIVNNRLHGYFVGGIVGLNDAAVNNCSLISRNYKNRAGDSVVGGDSFVGGIAGLNISSIGGTNENSADVFGKLYVGGIAGANTNALYDGDPLTVSDVLSVSFDANDLSVPQIESTDTELLIHGATNTGLVAAETSCSGGVCGYNTGKIIASVSRVNASSSLMEELKDYGLRCQYAGGVVGHNHGVLSEGGACSVVVYGGDNVGGLIGCNDYAGTIDNVAGYYLSGGYIEGNCYVGGLYGTNTAEGVLANSGSDVLKSKPNSVVGSWFVGGTIGASIISEDSRTVPIDCTVDNFLGTVTANRAFVGGYVGYLQLVAGNVKAIDVLNRLRLSPEASLTEAYSRVASVNTEFTKSEGNFLVESPDSIDRLSKVSGQVNVGGVVGYCAQSTKVEINGVANSANVTASSNVSFSQLKKLIPDTKIDGFINEQQPDYTASFSLAGGIIGYAGENVTIVNCANDESVTVRLPSSTTCAAALVEVNEGTVQNCTVASFQQQNRANVGGLVGINAGTISGCMLTGQVRGLANVGGIAVRNEGTISGCTVGSSLDCAVLSTGDCAGGIAAYNVAGAVIRSCHLDKNVNYTTSAGLANYVGGIAGRNYGSISDSTENTAAVSGAKIGGGDYIGGVAGINLGEISRQSSAANVYAVSGSAGGVAGVNSTGATIANCHSIGAVDSRTGYAGGIAAQNLSTINHSTNSGSVLSNSHEAGGIAAINRGTLSSCTNYAAISGYERVGGVCGANYGTVSACPVASSDAAVTSPDSDSPMLGGIAGENCGGASISESFGNKDSGAPSVSSNAPGAMLGGIAGKNCAGASISGASVGTVSSVNLNFSNAGENTAAVGGVCGVNLGSVSNYRVNATINSASCGKIASGITSTGALGGIAGVNGIDKEHTATITRCSFDGTATASNSSTTMANTAALGGIAGINNVDSTIEYCTLGVSSSASITGNNAYTGGIAGENFGVVQRCFAQEADYNTYAAGADLTGVPLSTQNVQLILSFSPINGCIGGIVATNERVTALVTDCSTGSSWRVNNNTASSSMTGGIISLNMSGRNSKNLINRASVTSATSYGGGIIGAIKWDDGNSGVGFVFDNCENYGSVQALDSAGGIVGYWQAFAGDFINCDNYGSLTITDGSNKIGAIIAHIYNHRGEEHFTVYNSFDRKDNYSIIGYLQVNQADITECSVSNNRYQSIKQNLNNHTIRSFSSTGSSTAQITNPQLNFDANRGRYTVSYSESGNRDYIKADIYRGTSASGTPFVTRYIAPKAGKLDFTLPYEWDDGGTSAFTIVLTPHGNAGYGSSVSVSSDGTKIALPEPTVRFVVLKANYSDTNDYGYFLIENAADYTALLGANNWSGKVTNGSGSVIATIDPTTGRSEPYIDQPHGYYTQISANDNSYYASPRVLSQFAYYDYLNTDVKTVAVSGVKFSGTSAEDLKLNFTMKNNQNHGSKVVYRAELVDSSGKLYGEAIIDVPAKMARTAVTLDVFNADEIVGKNLTLRWYPWEDELNLHYYSYQEISGYPFNGKLLSGTDFYSPYLVSGESALANYDDTSPNRLTAADAPSISANIETAGGSYTFKWSGTGANTCDVLITTYDAEHNVTKTLYTRSTTEGEVTVNASEWSCREITLTVTSRGTEGANGTTKLARTATRDYTLSTRLTTPLCPTVEILSKDELSYLVSGWTAVSDTSAEYQYISGYNIIVNCDGTDTKVATVGKTVHSTVVDLSAWRDKNVRISVVAVSSNLEERTNSAQSVPAAVLVSSRIETPSISGMTMTPNYTSAAITSAAFADPGIAFRETGSYGELIGSYEIEAYASAEQKNAPNTNTDVMLLGNGAMLSGSLSNASRYVSVDSDYAGWYVYVRMRAVSNSAISSLWSGWKVFRLPKLQIPEIDAVLLPLTRVAASQYTSEAMLSHELKIDGETQTVSNIAHLGVRWSGDSALSGYNFELQRRDNISATGNPTLSAPASNYKISGSGESLKLSAYKNESWVDITASAKLSDSDYPRLSGSSGYSAVYALADYQWSYSVNAVGSINEITLSPLLAVSESGANTVYTLVLPDCYLFAQEQRLTENVVISGNSDNANITVLQKTVGIWF